MLAGIESLLTCWVAAISHLPAHVCITSRSSWRRIQWSAAAPRQAVTTMYVVLRLSFSTAATFWCNGDGHIIWHNMKLSCFFVTRYSYIAVVTLNQLECLTEETRVEMTAVAQCNAVQAICWKLAYLHGSNDSLCHYCNQTSKQLCFSV